MKDEPAFDKPLRPAPLTYRAPIQNSSSRAWKKNASSSSSDKSSSVIPRRRQSTCSVSSAAMTRFRKAAAVGLVVFMHRLTASTRQTLDDMHDIFDSPSPTRESHVEVIFRKRLRPWRKLKQPFARTAKRRLHRHESDPYMRPFRYAA